MKNNSNIIPSIHLNIFMENSVTEKIIIIN